MLEIDIFNQFYKSNKNIKWLNLISLTTIISKRHVTVID